MSQPANATDETLGAVFAALADPTRRHVVELLCQQPTVTASSLAAELPISRQAIAKHLRALTEAGLLIGGRRGRETQYELQPQPLSAAMHWIADTEAQWDRRLQRLQDQLAYTAQTKSAGL